jgi:hypothetical protein
MTPKNETLISPLCEKPSLVLPLVTISYVAAFLFLCKIWFYLTGGTADWTLMNMPIGPIAVKDPVYVALAALVLVGAVLLAVQPARQWNEWPLSRTALFGCIATAFLAAIALAALLWTFNLDDKWAYYRTSRNIFSDRVPNYNAGEWFNINTSFLYPYLTLPGHFFGDFRAWESWTKFLGFGVHLGTALIVLAFLGLRPIAVLTAVASVLYVPSLLWSLGGLDTPMTVFAVVTLILLYLQKGPTNLLFWFLLGAMMWLRPDAILIGIGIFTAQLWLIPRPLTEYAVRGIAFSAPILLFVATNYFSFGNPLPSPFYIKGWNKTFSGIYPWSVDLGVGLTHLFSGLFASFLVVMIVFIGLWQLIQSTRVIADIKRPLLTNYPRHLCVLAGLIVFLGYHAAGGYQHMSFTFRYFLPGIVGLVVLCGHFLERSPIRGTAPLAGRVGAVGVVVFAILFQLVQSLFVGYHIKWVDLALTTSTLRDRFSVASYSEWMEVWLDAGQFLRTVAKPGDRIWLVQGLATGALTDSYLRDPYYAPLKWSKFEDLRTCSECTKLFDYLINWPGRDKIPPGFEMLKDYSNIALLRRHHDRPE